jgi:hypothetical protein
MRRIKLTKKDIERKDTRNCLSWYQDITEVRQMAFIWEAEVWLTADGWYFIKVC